MDIYSFINSHTVKEYCEKTGHSFNALESAFLVWKSNHHNMMEKHMAWREIIGSMADCEIAKRLNTKYYASLFRFLEQYMEIEKYLEACFRKKEQNAVYLFELVMEPVDYEEEQCVKDERLFTDFEECFAAAVKDADGLGRSGEVHIVKKYFQTNRRKECSREIKAVFRMDQTLLRMDSFHILSDAEADVKKTFDGIWIFVPTPFRKGDIVQVSDPLDRRIFVLDSLCTDDWELTERLLCSGDQMDMTAHGYWIDRMVQRCYSIPGGLFYNCMHYYPDMEYYTGPFQGEYRTLLALSNFIKGKIELPLFLDSYTFILQEEALQWTYKRLEPSWTQEGLRLAGLE